MKESFLIGYVAIYILLPVEELSFGNSGTLHPVCAPCSKESTGTDVG